MSKQNKPFEVGEGSILDQVKEYATGFVLDKGPDLLLAILTLLIGRWLIRLIVKSIGKLMNRYKIDESLHGFLVSFTRILLWILLIVSVASTLGIATTSFVTILGAAGLAVGLALQGSLSNFAGGVLILIFKPFKVGDAVEMQGISGSVIRIDILHTVVLTWDNREVVLPNGAVANDKIINTNKQGTRRVDMGFLIIKRKDLGKSYEIIQSIIDRDSRILKEPTTLIRLNQINEFTLEIAVRPWVKTADYYPVYWDTIEAVTLALEENGIEIPLTHPTQELVLKKPRE